MAGVCLALLEGPQRLIIGMLRSFQQPDSTMRRVTGSMHMFLSVQDAPARTFHEYHSATVKMDAAAPSVPDTDQAVKIVPEMSVRAGFHVYRVCMPVGTQRVNAHMGHTTECVHAYKRKRLAVVLRAHSREHTLCLAHPRGR